MPVSLPNSALAGRSVLIVEDEPLIALEVHAAFNAAGARIISAADTQEALRMVEGASY
jgi:CheY-like chemotaxis protein